MSMHLVHWSAKVSFQKNAIIGEVDRVKKTTSNFQLEKARIKAKFLKAGFQLKVIENPFNSLNDGNVELMIPRWFFDEILIVNNLSKVRFNIIWATKKIESRLEITLNMK